MEKLTTIGPVCMLILQSANPCFAQTVNGRIDSLVAALNEHYEISGNILVAKDGRMAYKRSICYTDLAARKQNNDSTTFMLISLAKPFTAISILQLKEEES